MKEKWQKKVSESWQLYLLYGFTIATTLAILWHQLFKLVPYASTSEVVARTSASSIDLILQNPLFLPHKLLQLLAFTVGYEGLIASRVISTLFAFAAIIFFYRVVRTWYTPRVALLASAVFVSSSWLLHAARISTPEVMYLLIVAILWVGLRMRTNSSRTLTIVMSGIVVSALLFVPGFIWIIMAGAVWQRKKILTELKLAKRPLLGFLGVSFALVFGLLGYAFSITPRLGLRWLGLPDSLVIREVLINLVLTPYHIFIRPIENPTMWLGRLPYVDIAITILFGLGVFVIYKAALLDRMRALAGIALIGAVLASFGVVPLLILMPLIFVTAASGIALLLQQWFTVFPKNPIARGIGVVAVAGLLSISVYYNMYRYFVAWPKNEQTQRAFTERIQ
jgi:hypothetical protein